MVSCLVMQMDLSSLLNSIDSSELLTSPEGGLSPIKITGIEYDSRKILPGNLFVALPGIHSDGHDFIDAAITKGAKAVLYQSSIARKVPGIAYVQVRDSRLAMSHLAAAFYLKPSSSLITVGVTGTEGKSTTVYLSYQLLAMAGIKTGFFSTVMSDTGDGEKPNPEHQTTPEATAVQRMLAQMRDSGLSCAVVEASSHGLSTRTSRLADVDFDVGVMTNVTSEHLEFHGTWECYRSDKANLFRNLDSHEHRKSVNNYQSTNYSGIPSFGVVNADDPSAVYFTGCSSKPTLSFSVNGSPASFMARDIRSDEGGTSFLIQGPEGFPLPSSKGLPLVVDARIEIPGQFNVGNSLAALIVASGISGKPWQDLVPLLSRLRPVRGRMTAVNKGQPFEVIIDYAHTPSSFQAILPPLRQRVQGRIFCLFGSGGERDREKRPRQAEVASSYCDILLLCDEDPRGEDPMALLEEIAAGCPRLERGKELFLIPDRPQAIRQAFAMAGPGDAVLLLGKGHENSIIYASHTMPYDEETEAEKALKELGYEG